MVKSPVTSSEDKSWQAEDDLRTMAHAEEIKCDPARMKACQQLAKKKMADIQAVMGMGTK